MGIFGDTQENTRSTIKVRETNFAMTRQEDERLDALYGPERPKCRICGGSTGTHKVLTRCLFCGAPEGQEGRV